MRKIRAAEVLLSAVMPPERAAAAIGDLLESAHGPVGFWWACGRTFTRTALRQVSLATSLRAIAMAFLIEAAIAIPVTSGLLRFQPSGSIGLVLLLASGILTPILAGYLLARRLPGLEAGAWIAVVLALSAASIMVSVANPPVPGVWLAYQQLRHAALLSAGVAAARWKTVARHSNNAQGDGT